MIFKIGDWIAFSYSAEPRQSVRDVKSMRQRTQAGATTWNEKKPIINTHEKYPTAIVLHPNWGGHVHCLLTNNYSQREINYLTAIVDPFFAAEKIKTDGELRSQLQRLQKDLNITSPQQFYALVVKPFIHLYDGYRLYFPNKMLNIKVVKRYSDIETRMKQPQQTQGQEKKPSGVIDTSTQSAGGDFFSRYAQSIARLRGPRFK